jgi:hypothetical protein
MTTIDLTEALYRTEDYESAYGGWRTRDGHVLAIATRAGRVPGRFVFGFVGPDGACRRETGGPVLPGPYAYGVPLSSCLAANPEHGTWGEIRRNKAAGTERDAAIGDTVVFRGHRFRIEAAPNDNISLVLVEGDRRVEYAARPGWMTGKVIGQSEDGAQLAILWSDLVTRVVPAADVQDTQE